MAVGPSKIYNAVSIANNANADSTYINCAGSEFVALFITADHALTVKVYGSPESGLMDGADPADWFALGSSIAVSANTPIMQVLTVGGASSLKLNAANASGATAVVTAWAKPSVNLIGR